MTAPAEPDKKNLIIVTGGDAKYFALLAEQIASIRARPQGESVPLAVLDGGLEPGQAAKLEALDARVLRPEWPSPQAKGGARGRDFFAHQPQQIQARPIISRL